MMRVWQCYRSSTVLGQEPQATAVSNYACERQSLHRTPQQFSPHMPPNATPLEWRECGPYGVLPTDGDELPFVELVMSSKLI
jgi:hypothetical protein